MAEIKKADPASEVHSPQSPLGRLSGGMPCGTEPTVATPLASKLKTAVAMVVAATAATGPALAKMSAMRGGKPSLIKVGLRLLRTQNKKASAGKPTATVHSEVLGSSCTSEVKSS